MLSSVCPSVSRDTFQSRLKSHFYADAYLHQVWERSHLRQQWHWHANPKTDFNAKWPFKVIQGHLFRCQLKATKGLHIPFVWPCMSGRYSNWKKQKSPLLLSYIIKAKLFHSNFSHAAIKSTWTVCSSAWHVISMLTDFLLNISQDIIIAYPAAVPEQVSQTSQHALNNVLQCDSQTHKSEWKEKECGNVKSIPAHCLPAHTIPAPLCRAVRQ